MSMTDSDKEGPTRAKPSLNTQDGVVNRMAHKTIGTTYKTAGNPDTNRLIFDEGSVKGFDSVGNNNIFIGYDPALSTRPIIRIADDGYSIDDEGHLILNSDNDVFKIADILDGNIAVSFAGFTQGASPGTFRAVSTNNASIPHGQDVIPAILPFIYDSTSNVYVPFADGSILNGVGWSDTNPTVTFSGANNIIGMATYYWKISITSDSVIVSGLQTGAAAPTVNIGAKTFPNVSIKIFVLQETAN